MPTWDEILKEAQSFTDQLLDKYLTRMHEHTGRTVIVYFSAFTLSKPLQVSPLMPIVDQDMQGFMTCSKGVNKSGLDLILHTPGGDYEATKRIIDYLHSTYAHIRVFVPHLAMSGGTLIACAADEIFMGPYSSIGPTDPQVPISGRLVPAEAIIAEFKRAFKESAEDPRKVLLWRERLSVIPPGHIDALETMVKNARKYLKELLKRRNLKNKRLTRYKLDKLVKVLSSYTHHSSHGRGINLKTAQELGLNVIDLRQDKELEDAVLSVYHAAVIVASSAPQVAKIIANHEGRKFVVSAPLPSPDTSRMSSVHEASDK